MRSKKYVVQISICLVILAGVSGISQTQLHNKEDDLGRLLQDIANAIEKNYTLAELLNLTEEAAFTLASAPASLSETVLSASEKGMYGTPLDENSEETIRQVYAAAGGRVLATGIRKDIGLFVTVEHPDSSFGSGKISTYGNLCDVAAATGDRIKKGDLLGSYDSTCGRPFYYTLEDKS